MAGFVGANIIYLFHLVPSSLTEDDSMDIDEEVFEAEVQGTLPVENTVANVSAFRRDAIIF